MSRDQAGSGSTEAPPDLEARGLALWAGYTKDRPTLAPGERVLLHEACRTTDRLDRLAAILSGDDEPWARIVVPERGDFMRLEVSSAVGEARQQQNQLRLTLASLEAVRGLTGQAANGQTPPTPEADPVDEFSRRREARRGPGTAGS